MAEPVRLLFLSEGVHSHGALQLRIAAAAAGRTDLVATFASVPAPGRLGFQLVRPYPPLGSLDLQPLRWRLRWSLGARRAVRRAAPAPDAVLVNTQACALALRGEMRSRPVVLSVDATARQFAALEYWRPRDRLSRHAERPLDALERRAYRDAAAVVAWTDWVAGSLRADYGVPPERIVTLNPGVDAASFAGLPRREAAPGEPLRVLFVGNGAERKGLPLLLEAARRLRNAVALDVVTEDRVGEAPGVRVHRGLRPGSDELLRLFAAAGAFALPSRADAAPWAILEAQAAGLPLVSTSVGAIPELVGDAGLLVAPGDVEGIACALRRLAEEPELRARLGERGRAQVRERYDAARQMPRLLDLLGDLARGAPRA